MRLTLVAVGLILAFAGFAWVFTETPVHVRAAQTEIEADDFYFCDQSFEGAVCEKTIAVGDTVVWSVEAGSHTVTECDATFATCPPSGGFDSGTLNQGQQFQRTFNASGTFSYKCLFHPQQMRGRLVVQAQATPSPTPSPTPSGTAAATAARTASPSPAAVPSAGGQPGDGAAGPIAGLAVIAGTLAAIAGAAVIARGARLKSNPPRR